MKNILKKIFKSFFIQLFSFFILTWFIAFAAISWPQGSPDGEVSWGVFMEQFNKIRNNSDCWEWKYLAWYNTNFEKICKTVPAGSQWVQWPLWPVWPQWDTSIISFKCPAWQFVSGFTNNSPICTTPTISDSTASSWDRYTMYDNDNWVLNFNYSSDYKMLEARFKIIETTNWHAVITYSTVINWTKWESMSFIRTTNFTISCWWSARSCDTWKFTTNFWYNSNTVYWATNTWWYWWNWSTDVKIVLVKLKWFK